MLAAPTTCTGVTATEGGRCVAKLGYPRHTRSIEAKAAGAMADARTTICPVQFAPDRRSTKDTAANRQIFCGLLRTADFCGLRPTKDRIIPDNPAYASLQYVLSPFTRHSGPCRLAEAFLVRPFPFASERGQAWLRSPIGEMRPAPSRFEEEGAGGQRGFRDLPANPAKQVRRTEAKVGQML